MHVEVWSDVVCPWCFIGKRRLDLALASFDGEVTVTHRAFQLNPGALTEGQLTVDMLASKYGVSPQQAAEMQANVSEVAASVGLDYHLDRTVSGNTRDAHRLILWAQDQGAAGTLLESIYSAYFEHARPVFTSDDLIPMAIESGLDGEAARAMLASDAYIEQVHADQDLAGQFGASGVPFFVFDRRYGISGAQPLEVFEQTLRKAAEAA